MNNKLVRVDIIPEYITITPGQKFHIAIRFSIEKGWHIFWRNPGDSGLPTKLTWTLPDGFTVSSIRWPAPDKYQTSGITDYGYEDEVVLFAEVTAPEKIYIGENFIINIHVSWLVCKEKCIPGQSSLSDTITSGERQISSVLWTNEISDVLNNQIPKKIKEGIIHSELNDSLLTIRINYLHSKIPNNVIFYPYSPGIIDNSSKQELTVSENDIVLYVKLNDLLVDLPNKISGILISDSGWLGLSDYPYIEFETEIHISK